MNAKENRTKARIETALAVFVEGFAETKSRTWPYEAIRHKSIWQMRDAERKKSSDYRKEEWIAFDVEPEKVHELAKAKSRNGFFVCAFAPRDESVDELKSKYRVLGYRLLSTEPLFVHDLKRIPRSTSDTLVCMLRAEHQSEEFATANRIRPPKPEVYTVEEYRQYLAYVDDKLVGWVRSVETAMGNWCSNLFVAPAFRRRGIAKKLLCTMLRDDRDREADQSVLLSSHAGALLYPLVGYKPLGTLLLMAPPKES